MEMMKLRMVPMNSVACDIRRNGDAILNGIDSAADDGVDLVCFPELSLTGYSMPVSREHPSNEGDIGVIVDKTAESGIVACFGYVDEEGHIAQAIAEGGKLLGKYCKTHLGDKEIGVMTPGNSFPVFATKKAKVSIQICWEAHFPEISGMYALQGADVILMPFASGLGGERRQSSWDRVLPARAYDNTVFAAACNAFGNNGRGVTLGGGAAVYNVRGERLACSQGDKAIDVILDPEQMERIRVGRYESMKDVYFLDKRRPELYGKLMK